MKKILVIALILICSNVVAQTGKVIVAAVEAAQKSLQRASYKVARQDTLLTGEIRSMTGNVIIEKNATNQTFGFLFKATMDGINDEYIYDGKVGYLINNLNKTYTTKTNSDHIKHMLNGGGGWLIMPELMNLDTTGVTRLDAKLLGENYFLTLKFPDYLPENVINRYKIIIVNKWTMLPVAVRNHSETNGRVQDLFWRIEKITTNENAEVYDFTLPFLNNYSQQITSPGAPPAVFSLLGNQAPNFLLRDFIGHNITLNDFKGKVVVLDFWELWCAPCIASMPKIQLLYQTYKRKGLQVIGIMNDIKQLVPAKKMLDIKNYNFPMLLGNEQLKKDYKLNGLVPMYIVINKTGKITFVGGFDNVEKEVSKALFE